MKNLQQLQAKCEALCKEIEELKSSEKQIDFSEFIGRNGNTLAIKGEKSLKSYAGRSIIYNEFLISSFTDHISYTETTLDKLEYGDVFCLKKDKNYKLKDFGIFIGQNNNGNYLFQFLNQKHGIETIDFEIYFADRIVYKFNRN